MKILTYFEIDVDVCSLTYGESPCTANIVTGGRKCFNSLGTCQDRGNFAESVKTFRFAINADYLPLADIPCIPNIQSYSYSPGKISLGIDLGVRSTLTVVFEDHRHDDAGPDWDKYPESRAYRPYGQGTFWGKWRARHPYLTGRKARLIRGVLGQAYEDMEVIHMIVDNFTGPSGNNTYTLVCKDVLSLVTDEKAQAPVLSSGRLIAGIANNTTSVTLTPPGVGAEYPSPGRVCLGGKEVCTFTRSGDVLTLVRGQDGTTAVAHSANDRVQLCLRYNSQNAADILYDLFVNYGGIDPAYITLTDWQNEVNTFLQQQYSTVITEPTSVNALIKELIEIGALAIWWDAKAQKIRLQVLREVTPQSYVYDESNILEGAFDIQEQPELRISQVYMFFARRDPTRPLTDEDNYRTTDLSIDLPSSANYKVSSIKKIYSRWIGLGGLAIAQAVSSLILSQYKVPPRLASLAIPRNGQPELEPGIGYKVGFWPIQDDEGAPLLLNCQVVGQSPSADTLAVQVEEMNFKRSDVLSTRYIYLNSTEPNINLRTLHDTFYPAPQPGDVGLVTIHAIIDTTAVIFSNVFGQPALNVGSWPLGLEVIVEIKGAVRGRCGNGGNGGRGGNASGSTAGAGVNGSPGQAGSAAIYTRKAIKLRYSLGDIWGGAGGGGGGPGGGAMVATSLNGQQTLRVGGSGGGGGGRKSAEGGTVGGTRGLGGTATSGSSGFNGTSGGTNLAGTGGARQTITGGAYAGRGCDGGLNGDWGQPGVTPTNNAENGNGNISSGARGSPGAGGAAGAAIDGWSYVTVEGAAGDLRGPTIN